MPSDIAKRHEVINFARKFDLFSEQWQPKVVAELNDYQFKVVRSKVISSGTITRKPTRLSSFSTANCASISGIDPSCWGRARCSSFPRAPSTSRSREKEVKMLLIEPRGTLNTGHEGGERTAENDVWTEQAIGLLGSENVARHLRQRLSSRA